MAQQFPPSGSGSAFPPTNPFFPDQQPTSISPALQLSSVNNPPPDQPQGNPTGYDVQGRPLYRNDLGGLKYDYHDPEAFRRCVAQLMQTIEVVRAHVQRPPHVPAENLEMHSLLDVFEIMARNFHAVNPQAMTSSYRAITMFMEKMLRSLGACYGVNYQ